MNYKGKHHPCVTLYYQFSSFHLFYQKDNTPIQKLLQIFKILFENIERYSGKFGNNPAILEYLLDREGLIYKDDFPQMDTNIKQIYLKKAIDQFLAILCLLGGNCNQYSQLVAEIQNTSIMGEDK